MSRRAVSPPASSDAAALPVADRSAPPATRRVGASRRRPADAPPTPEEAAEAAALVSAARRAIGAEVPPHTTGASAADDERSGSLHGDVVAMRRAAPRPGPLVGLLAALPVALLAVLTALSAERSPRLSGPVQLRMIGDNIPEPLKVQLERGFPDYARLITRPDAALVQAYALYLGQRSLVYQVNKVEVVGEVQCGKPQCVVQVDVRLRKPLLPAELANGQRVWISDDGRLLPGILRGPYQAPLVRGLEQGGEAAIQEAVACWTSIQSQIRPDLIREIRCDHPMSGGGHGLALITRPGTVIVWGAPSENRFGLTARAKAANLVHTLACQGDLARVAEINVRFSQAFATLTRP
jgi:hypothetical protein